MKDVAHSPRAVLWASARHVCTCMLVPGVARRRPTAPSTRNIRDRILMSGSETIMGEARIYSSRSTRLVAVVIVCFQEANSSAINKPESYSVGYDWGP